MASRRASVLGGAEPSWYTGCRKSIPFCDPVSWTSSTGADEVSSPVSRAAMTAASRAGFDAMSNPRAARLLVSGSM